MNIYKVLTCCSLVLVIGCSSNDPYPITESIAKINEKQILDPMAPENNEGIVNDLEGNYGSKVVKSYQGSSVSPSAGQSGDQNFGSSSGSGGKN